MDTQDTPDAKIASSDADELDATKAENVSAPSTSLPPTPTESTSVDEVSLRGILGQLPLSKPNSPKSGENTNSGNTQSQQIDPATATVQVSTFRIDKKARDVRSPASASPLTQGDADSRDTPSATPNLAVIAAAQNTPQDRTFPVEPKSIDKSQTAELAKTQPTTSAPQTDPSPQTDQSPQPDQVVALPFAESRTTSAPPAASGELAFAARLVPAATAPDTGSQAQDSGDSKPRAQVASQLLEKQVNGSSSIASGPAAPADKGPASSLIEQFVKSDVAVTAPTAVAQTSSAAPMRTETPAPPTPGSVVNRMDQMIESPNGAAVSNHDITVRVPDATERGMDVRFVERGGEVHVSVRTSDEEMAQTLRGGLNDLVGRFEHGGVRTEVWRPGQDAASPRNGSDSQDSNQKGSGSGQNQQQRENRRQAEKPRWVEAMEVSAGKKSGPTSE